MINIGSVPVFMAGVMLLICAVVVVFYVRADIASVIGVLLAATAGGLLEMSME